MEKVAVKRKIKIREGQSIPTGTIFAQFRKLGDVASVTTAEGDIVQLRPAEFEIINDRGLS